MARLARLLGRRRQPPPVPHVVILLRRDNVLQPVALGEAGELLPCPSLPFVPQPHPTRSRRFFRRRKGKGPRLNWNTTAAQAASQIHQGLRGIERGVALLLDAPGVAVLFGNDNYAEDERARLEVELIRQSLEDLEIEELGFGLNRDMGGAPVAGDSWAMLVRSDETDRLAGILGDAWRIVADHQPCEE